MIKMAEVLQRIATQSGSFVFDAELQRIPCFGHALNLAVQYAIKDGLCSEAGNGNLYDDHAIGNDLVDQNDILGKARKGIRKIKYVAERGAGVYSNMTVVD